MKMLAVNMLVRFRLPYPQYSRLSDIDITAPCILKMLVNTAPNTSATITPDITPAVAAKHRLSKP